MRRAAAAGSIRGCWPSRRRPGRATTPTPSSGCGSSGAPRWSTRSARWAPTSPPSRTTRSAGSRRSRRGPRSPSSGSSATSSTRPTLTPEERREVSDQIAFYKGHRELFQCGRFVRLRSPFEGDGNETAWMSVAADRRQARRRAVPGPEPAGARPGPAPPARARPGGRLPGLALAVDRRRHRAGERARPRRRRPHGGRAAPRRGRATRPRVGATSGRGCSSSRRSSDRQSSDVPALESSSARRR